MPLAELKHLPRHQLAFAPDSDRPSRCRALTGREFDFAQSTVGLLEDLLEEHIGHIVSHLPLRPHWYHSVQKKFMSACLRNRALQLFLCSSHAEFLVNGQYEPPITLLLSQPFLCALRTPWWFSSPVQNSLSCPKFVLEWEMIAVSSRKFP
jgi:hypothetical protein